MDDVAGGGRKFKIGPHIETCECDTDQRKQDKGRQHQCDREPSAALAMWAPSL